LAGASAGALLEAAAMGRIGVDRRLIRSILESPAPAAEVLGFTRAPHTGHRIDLDPLLVDLFRYFRSPEALEFYLDAIRHHPEDVDDELIEALLPFGEKAIEPLMALYEELGEERSADIAFLLAGLRVHDPRVLALLIERLEYDAADGAFCLGLLGDKAARPALEKMLAEIPEEDLELRREISHAIDALDEPPHHYVPESFDVLERYEESELPPFDLLPEPERIEMLAAGDPEVRAGAAYSFFNSELSPAARAGLLSAARLDSDPKVRGRAWQSLSDAVDKEAIRDELIAVLNDPSKPVVERGGAAVGLHLVADRDDVSSGIEALYELNGEARVWALEAMWRSLWEPYAKFVPENLDDADPEILRQTLRAAGYFRLTRYADKIAKFFDREEPYASLREDALFAYALAMPGETTRGRVRGMLRKIDSVATLAPYELELVEFALNERLRLEGLDPVFDLEGEEEEPELDVEPAKKAGRNDPCPCGSGKKFKKCCGL
jgi:hypothetical protein